jgi:hypothetical protein
LTLDPGFGIVFPDPGSHTYIFDSLMTNFCLKSTIILSVLAKKNFYLFKHKIFQQFYDIFGYKMVGWDKKNFPSSFGAVIGSGIRDLGSGIRDPGWIKIRIRDNIPVTQHC